MVEFDDQSQTILIQNLIKQSSFLKTLRHSIMFPYIRQTQRKPQPPQKCVLATSPLHSLSFVFQELIFFKKTHLIPLQHSPFPKHRCKQGCQFYPPLRVPTGNTRNWADMGEDFSPMGNKDGESKLAGTQCKITKLPLYI